MTRTHALVAVAALVLVGIIGACFASRRGRTSFRGALPEITPAQTALAQELERDVRALCANGSRNTWAPEAMTAAARYIESSLVAAGHRVEHQTFPVMPGEIDGDNLLVELRGASKAGEIVVIGAHYDSADGAPGADDNASGVAATLALARRFAKAKPARTLRFVFFANEEPPHFQTPTMGSYRYAKLCSERKENIVAMLSLEMLGYYDPRKGAQAYPPPLAAMYPDTGDFIAFAGNIRSRALVRQSVNAFRAAVRFPAESAVLPEVIPEVGWSDHWSFWQFGWPAAIVSDTAMFRNPHYHTERDLPGTLDYPRMARVVEGLVAVVNELARG